MSSLTRAGNAADSFICISFGLCRRWMFTNDRARYPIYLVALVGELVAGV